MTSPQRSPAEVKAEWQKRRIRRWIAAGILITICVLLLISLVAFRFFMKPGLFPFLMFVWAVFLGFLRWNKRCPACGKDPGGAFQPAWQIKNCKNCGAQLED